MKPKILDHQTGRQSNPCRCVTVGVRWHCVTGEKWTWRR